MAKRKDSTVQAADNFRLKVIQYEPLSVTNPAQIVVINAGAGIPQALYEPFANWLADHGIPSFTYDYRGIGQSRGRSLKGLDATIKDWGSKDCAAVVSHANALYPQAVVHIVAHSIGGIVTGFVTPSSSLGRLLFISPHTGYLGEYAPSSRVKMFFLWHVAMPMVTVLVGYFPGRFFGLPEDLPYGVAMEWARRRFQCNLATDESYGAFSPMGAPGLALLPSDDLFATNAAMERVSSKFTNARIKEMVLRVERPNRIGHFGFFYPRSRERLWPLALAWLSNGTLPCPVAVDVP